MRLPATLLRRILPAIILGLIAAYGYLRGPAPGSALPGTTAPTATVAHQSTSRAPTAAGAVGFRDAAHLEEHFHKHGAEFQARSAEEYLNLAQALRDRPAGGDILQAARTDGTVTRYDRGSGAFIAFGADGVIRTFFRPNDGEAYFRRQLRRQPTD